MNPIPIIIEYLNMVLIYFYNLTGNYGIAIILLTLLVRLVTFPLTNKQLSSSRAMQKLQPKVNKIKEKYKNDKTKLNEETMKLWKENKVNPAAGCFPLLLQIPILFAIFRVLREAEFLVEIVPGFDPSFLVWSMIETDPYYVLPILAGATTFLQQKLMMTDKSQQMMLYIMPAMLVFFSTTFPAGLVLYWVINNTLSIGHHLLLNKLSAKEVVSE